MRVLVKAGEKGTGRIEVPVAPDKIMVNDGSVPEANLGNNVYDVPPPRTSKVPRDTVRQRLHVTEHTESPEV